jgi:hypothetical protein
MNNSPIEHGEPRLTADSGGPSNVSARTVEETRPPALRGRGAIPVRVQTLSECGRYEYTYSRRWADGTSLTFVGLNPSLIAVDPALDGDGPTVQRMESFALREGFGALRTLNLYALRSTAPAGLWIADDPVGPENDAYLVRYLQEAVTLGQPVIACWGALARVSRARQVMGLVSGVDWRCIGRTNSGQPRHPLYVRGDTPLTPFASQ